MDIKTATSMNRNYTQGRNRGCASTANRGANRVGVERCPDSVGYRTPLEAMTEGGHEKMLWLPCSVPQKDRPDYLATVCVDQDSPDYCKVVHRLEMPYCGDSLHHMNWNTCSSCYGNPSKRRDKLVLPCLDSDRVYVADLAHNPRAPTLYKVIEGDELHREGLSAPHTTHCLASGEVMISTMGDENENAKGSFLLLEERTFNVRGTWQPQLDVSDFGYDFWYQPRHNVMVSSQWGAPSAFRKGFNMADVEQGLYGSSLVVWDWTYRRKLQTIDLGPEGTMPLEVRFLHNPDASEGYVGCALGGTVFRFFKTEAKGESWAAEKVISVPAKKVKGWAMDVMPAIITDILISLDDRFLYVACWVHGDVRQYDITDTSHPKLVGQGQPARCTIQGKPVRGAAQMLQLSLDGKRLYASTTLYGPWDKQFYPEMWEEGGMVIRMHANTVKGGLTIDQSFLVDFADEPDGPSLGHEIRLPGGDSTSDIWT
ncbi:methanethiol oxidase-like isoform X3 [Dermacentor andersoni]|uniref:methanethiol oxidase-like isoform X3 n=1 Tax=Dermacentor andersoni TaxID=34620 RepID=UPI0024175A24|nr:methanethiol oxidase-like isoform X3 [Dermacentor andersoni]